MLRSIKLSVLCLLFAQCSGPKKEVPQVTVDNVKEAPFYKGVSLLVLGTAQDAGSPQIACKKDCCKNLFKEEDSQRSVVALGLIDAVSKKTYLFEATPDINFQLRQMKNHVGWTESDIPDGIFLTHAHIGHYTGLMYLGKEATNASSVPVFAMPKMKGFLETNGPWNQLVSNKNIGLKPILEKQEIILSAGLKVVPFVVPHRDEYSETVGYKILGPNKSALFIPDIDKWSKWDNSILTELKSVDYAFLDATFFNEDEVNNRDISEIPHPFVIESMSLFNALSVKDKKKVHFIHFNHTNPLLDPMSKQTQSVLDKGYSIARKGMRLQL